MHDMFARIQYKTKKEDSWEDDNNSKIKKNRARTSFASFFPEVTHECCGEKNHYKNVFD